MHLHGGRGTLPREVCHGEIQWGISPTSFRKALPFSTVLYPLQPFPILLPAAPKGSRCHRWPTKGFQRFTEGQIGSTEYTLPQPHSQLSTFPSPLQHHQPSTTLLQCLRSCMEACWQDWQMETEVCHERAPKMPGDSCSKCNLAPRMAPDPRGS